MRGKFRKVGEIFMENRRKFLEKYERSERNALRKTE